MMDKYYQVEEEENDQGKKFYDEEGNFAWDKGSSSSSSDDQGVANPQADGDQEEAEADISGFLEDDQSEELWDEEADIPYGETVEEENLGKRIALNKMDWDVVSATDLFALFSSLCTGDKIIKKVDIYPSLFGIEKMKEDNMYGPPKEIFDPGEVKPKRHRKKMDSSDEEDMAIQAGFAKQEDNMDAFN
jgi:hypothetical protein